MEILFPENMKVNAKFGKFEVATDQKKKAGGDESAPEPFNLLLVSIGTCAGIYVLSFCKERKIDTEGLKMFLKTETDKVKRMLSKITIDIELPPRFPEKYINAVKKTADLCSVKKHMLEPPEFVINATIKS